MKGGTQPNMDEDVFVLKLNEIARDHHLKLPVLKRDETLSPKFMEQWAGFLEACLRKGLPLSDPMWQRLRVDSNSPHARFALEGSGEPPDDADFRIGLQLLIGLMDEPSSDAD
jgi:hypothetical protein